MTAIFETADAAQDSTTLYRMAAGDVFFGKLKTDAIDWIRVDLIAGQTYSFAAIGLGALATGATDTDIILRAADSSELASDGDSGPGQSASLTYTALESGAFFIDLCAYASGTAAQYWLSMTAGVLLRPGLSWAATPQTPVTMTWVVRATGPTGDGLPLEVLDAVQIEGMTRPLANFSDVANVSFVQVAPGGTSDDATILVGAYSSETDDASAYASFPGSADAASADGDMWINNYWATYYIPDLPLGSLEYMIYLHQLGHALGLDHPGDYDGGGFTYADNAQFTEDSHQYSVMSYWESDETEPDSPLYRPGTLMMFDIYALQQLYGVNNATRAGNDVYGFNSTVGGAYDFTFYVQPQICIWDGAGKDTLDVSGYAAKQRIDLNAGTFSDVGGFKGNVSIAVGARIEKAIGGSGNDRLTGNAFGNSLNGGKGNDALEGGTGKDKLTGGAGSDSIVFHDAFGKDRIIGFDVAKDILILDSALWGGVAASPELVTTAFGHEDGANTVLDFGGGEIFILVNRLVLAELSAAIVILRPGQTPRLARMAAPMVPSSR